MQGADKDELNRLLRVQMTAVNQQFTHVLALRAHSEHETAARIMEVDEVDFPNAMRIMDYLVQTESGIDITSEGFLPGADAQSILRAEQVMEARLASVLDSADCSDETVRQFVQTAKSPRADYAIWLAERVEDRPGVTPVAEPPASRLVSFLIVMLEQAMAHAFVHWHHGEESNADAAWMSSGAAMMYLTSFVNKMAEAGSVPIPGELPALHIADAPARALANDRALAQGCADEADRATAAERTGKHAVLCQTIARKCRELARWQPGEPHPAARINPAVFGSFRSTHEKFVAR